MGLYEGIKDVAKVVQQADNIDLYKKLLDLGAQALDMQEEIAKLKVENKRLQEEINSEKDIISHKTEMVDEYHYEHPYITLASDKQSIRYCAVCWGLEKKLIPLYDELNCLICNNRHKG